MLLMLKSGDLGKKGHWPDKNRNISAGSKGELHNIFNQRHIGGQPLDVTERSNMSPYVQDIMALPFKVAYEKLSDFLNNKEGCRTGEIGGRWNAELQDTLT
jgi:hypothetical protein